MAKSQRKPAPQKKLSVAEKAAQAAQQDRLFKDWETLLQQPASLATLTEAERDQVIISSIASNGENIVLSRYGDDVWDLSPFINLPNRTESQKKIDWRNLPESFRQPCKAALYRWWKIGNPGREPPTETSVRTAVLNLGSFCRALAAMHLKSFTEVQALHIANYIHAQKAQGYALSTLTNRFFAIELLYTFRDQHPDLLRTHPWPESSTAHVAGRTGQANKDSSGIAKTPLIPGEVAQKLFQYAESILNRADSLLDERDRSGKLFGNSKELNAIRNACFFLLGVLTGARSSELSSIEVGALRKEERDGYTFCWLQVTEYKNKRGLVEYLAPSMVVNTLKVLERWSQPYRERLAADLVTWEASDARDGETLKKIAHARANANRLFLGISKKFGLVQPLSSISWNFVLKLFATGAGVDWDLAAHQTRRLYAYTFCQHRLGNILFLKEQLKHSSLNVTQLYASNPRQDPALYDEILREMMDAKVGLVAGWMEADNLLAGGMGKKMMKLRAHVFPNRKALIEETADRINLRSNGHAWCLAQDEGCGGSGIYKKGTCGECSNGVIDKTFAPIWHEALDHHRVLLEDARLLGPGAVMRVERDIKQAEKILRDLGELPKNTGKEDVGG